MKQMNFYLVATVVLLLSLKSTKSQIIGFGYCPEVEVQQQFFVGDYIGYWYEYARYPTFFEFFDICVRVEYYYDFFAENELRNSKRVPSGGNINNAAPKYSYDIIVNISAIRDLFFVKQNLNILGKVRKESTITDEGKLLVNFKGKESPYWVLSTDYKSYSLVYACTEYYSLFHLKYFWVLTRSPNPGYYKIRKINEEIAKQSHIYSFLLAETNQYECPY